MMARFRPGRLVAAPGALELLQEAVVDPIDLLARHLSGDWGDLDTDDKAANEQALLDGGRLFSSYTLPDEAKVWVITEAVGDDGQRSCTTILLPADY